MKVWRSWNLAAKLKDYIHTTMQELMEELYYQDKKNILDHALQIQQLLYEPQPA